VHLRPSGNAPDFRIYTEADSGAKAGAMLATALEQVRRAISGK
jgi:phosphomannomutase